MLFFGGVQFESVGVVIKPDGNYQIVLGVDDGSGYMKTVVENLPTWDEVKAHHRPSSSSPNDRDYLRNHKRFHSNEDASELDGEVA